MSFDHLLSAFISESRDLLETMEQELLALERGAGSADTINAIFRAAHTIKGSGGMFGLEPIVAFTHVVETALDRARSGALPLTSVLVALMLECKDHIGAMIEIIAGSSDDFTPLQSRQDFLLSELHKHLNGGIAASSPPPASSSGKIAQAVVQTVTHATTLPQPAAALATRAPTAPVVSVPVQQDPQGGSVDNDAWHISVRFKPDILKFGLDPLTIIRYLSEFGQLLAVHIVDDGLPPINHFDPESCYLGFEIRFCSPCSKEKIENAFEFVIDDCALRILPPRSRIDDYIGLIQELPESDARLGEILVQCGSLTRDELHSALRYQSECATNSASPPRPLGEILIEQKVVHPPVVEAALEEQRHSREKVVEKRAFRVDAGKLDGLIDRVGELIIAGASTQLVAQKIRSTELTEALSVLARLVEDVRDQALKLRMVPLSDTFSRFQRLVRDVARELGKDIRLEIHGGETELDKTLIEQIVDPLTHLVRNSIDHGIEAADLRTQRGKPAHGLIHLNAFHESGSVVIEVSDDGGGLARDRILKKAIARGLVADGASLSDREIHELIFEPGFSTAEQVTNLSGRGVGMDVVRRNVTNLRGSIEIDSQEGIGSTMRVRLPLTLAIIEGFLVRVARSIFVIPLNLVEECIELPDDLPITQHAHDYIDLRGAPLPFIRLRDVVGNSGRANRRESIVVVRSSGRRCGLVVDELMGEMQTVIKPLSKIFNHLRGIAGSTILGDGTIALILDVNALMAQVQLRDRVNSRELPPTGHAMSIAANLEQESG